MNVTDYEKLWLNEHGGRTPDDLHVSPDGEKFVYMGDGNGGEKAVYLPKNRIRQLFWRKF